MKHPESRRQRIQQFLRSILVGSAATLADMAVLIVCARGLGMPPAYAKVLALVVGVVVQFFGGRSFTFQAQGGSMRRQAVLFAGVEVVSLSLNWAAFQLLVQRVGMPIEPANLLGGFVVFVGFSCPAWRIVFRGATPQTAVVADDPGARLSAA